MKHIKDTTNYQLFLPSSVPYRFIDAKMKVTVCKEDTVSSKQSKTYCSLNNKISSLEIQIQYSEENS